LLRAKAKQVLPCYLNLTGESRRTKAMDKKLPPRLTKAVEVRAEPAAKDDSYLAKMFRYIHGKIVAAYRPAFGALKAANWIPFTGLLWGLVAMLGVFTPIWILNASNDSGKPRPIYQVIASRNQIAAPPVLTESLKKDKGRHCGGSAAVKEPKEHADGKEVFVHLFRSRDQEDKFIDVKKKKLCAPFLCPGPYATTLSDYLMCIILNDDPIDRYGLPNKDKIKWAFYIQPKANDWLQRGIVQPANHQDGGGVEVYFAKGTSNNTYLYARPYGELHLKTIPLREENIQYLSNFPECGMGYQIVDIRLKNGQCFENRIVLHSRYLLIDNCENIDSAFIEEVGIRKNEGWK
jgi:hypothetical protein